MDAAPVGGAREGVSREVVRSSESPCKPGYSPGSKGSRPAVAAPVGGARGAGAWVEAAVRVGEGDGDVDGAAGPGEGGGGGRSGGTTGAGEGGRGGSTMVKTGWDTVDDREDGTAGGSLADPGEGPAINDVGNAVAERG